MAACVSDEVSDASRTFDYEVFSNEVQLKQP